MRSRGASLTDCFDHSLGQPAGYNPDRPEGAHIWEYLVAVCALATSYFCGEYASNPHRNLDLLSRGSLTDRLPVI